MEPFEIRSGAQLSRSFEVLVVTGQVGSIAQSNEVPFFQCNHRSAVLVQVILLVNFVTASKHGSVL